MLSAEESYKTYHISQMHSNGTTPYEIVLTAFPLYLFTCLSILLMSIIVNAYRTVSVIFRFIFDFVLIITPFIISITILSHQVTFIVTFLLAVLLTVILLLYDSNVDFTRAKNLTDTSFITFTKSMLNIMTVTTILGVDFSIFPRHYAKTEDFGYSLMDLGVGLFIYTNGIVAPETKGRTDSIKKSVKSSIPLIILGIGRLVTTKSLNYKIPISEYGTHWNFYFTLAFTKIFSSLILNVFNIDYIYINAILLLGSHEMLLQSGLQQFVMTDVKRDDFLTANREGIVSSMGYLSLYLFSVYFGHIVQTNLKKKNSLNTLSLFFKATFLFLALSIVFQRYFGLSRKVANSAFCFWVLSFGCFMITMSLLIQILLELIFGQTKYRQVFSPIIFEAINYNGLAFFLLGNVLTGLVNLSCNTLLVDKLTSLGILIGYMLINCLFVYVLYSRKIKLKVP